MPGETLSAPDARAVCEVDPRLAMTVIETAIADAQQCFPPGSDALAALFAEYAAGISSPTEPQGVCAEFFEAVAIFEPGCTVRGLLTLLQPHASALAAPAAYVDMVRTRKLQSGKPVVARATTFLCCSLKVNVNTVLACVRDHEIRAPGSYYWLDVLCVPLSPGNPLQCDISSVPYPTILTAIGHVNLVVSRHDRGVDEYSGCKTVRTLLQLFAAFQCGVPVRGFVSLRAKHVLLLSVKHRFKDIYRALTSIAPDLGPVECEADKSLLTAVLPRIDGGIEAMMPVLSDGLGAVAAQIMEDLPSRVDSPDPAFVMAGAALACPDLFVGRRLLLAAIEQYGTRIARVAATSRYASACAVQPRILRSLMRRVIARLVPHLLGMGEHVEAHRWQVILECLVGALEPGRAAALLSDGAELFASIIAAHRSQGKEPKNLYILLEYRHKCLRDLQGEGDTATIEALGDLAEVELRQRTFELDVATAFLVLSTRPDYESLYDPIRIALVQAEFGCTILGGMWGPREPAADEVKLAVSCLASAVDVLRSTPKHFATVGKILVYLGRYWAGKGGDAKAAETCAEGLDLIVEGAGTESLAYIEGVLMAGSAYQMLGQNQKALELLTEGLLLRHVVKPCPKLLVAQLYAAKGFAHENLNDHLRALQCRARVVALYRVIYPRAADCIWPDLHYAADAEYEFAISCTRLKAYDIAIWVLKGVRHRRDMLHDYQPHITIVNAVEGMAKAYIEKGDFDSAEPFYVEVIDLLDKLRATYRQIVERLLVIGQAQLYRGHVSEARKHIERAIEIVEANPSEFPRGNATLPRLLTFLGFAYNREFMFDKAVDTLKAVVTLTLGNGELPEANTCATLVQLGRALAAQKAYEASCNTYYQAAVLQSTLDSHSPRRDLASAMIETISGHEGAVTDVQRLEKAIELIHKAIEQMGDVWGQENHESAIPFLIRLSLIERRLGRFDAAKQHILAACTRAAGLFGTSTAHANLLEDRAELLLYTGEGKLAVEVYAQVVAMRDAVATTDTKATFALSRSLFNLGRAYAYIDEPARAREQYVFSLSRLVDSLQCDEEIIANSADNMSEAEASIAKAADALPDADAKAWWELRARVMMAYALTAAEMGRLADAEMNMASGLAAAVRLVRLGAGNRELVPYWHAQGLILLYKADYEQSMVMLRKAEEVLRGHRNAESDGSLASIQFSIGRVLAHQGLFDAALEMFSLASGQLAMTLGDTHPAAATARLELGVACVYTGQLRKAISELKLACKGLATGRARKTLLHCFGIYELARAYFTAGAFAAAERVLIRALMDAEELLGPVHLLVADISYDLARVRLPRNSTQAITDMRDALSIYTAQLGPAHPRTVRVSRDLALQEQVHAMHAMPATDDEAAAAGSSAPAAPTPQASESIPAAAGTSITETAAAVTAKGMQASPATEGTPAAPVATLPSTPAMPAAQNTAAAPATHAAEAGPSATEGSAAPASEGPAVPAGTVKSKHRAQLSVRVKTPMAPKPLVPPPADTDESFPHWDSMVDALGVD
eukprot:m.8145 g.8145  ORF g.8145 m.8145 type:complete len:1530 (-) comp2257_c0_seq1:227-4816(-)